MGVVGIVLSLVLLMLLAYRGVSMIVLAPLVALFTARKPAISRSPACSPVGTS